MSDRSEYWKEYARTHREQRRAIERRREERRRAARGPIVKKCVVCGCTFKPNSNNQIYCSSCSVVVKKRNCIGDSKKPSERFPHTCPICGKDFIARKDRIFCSHECAVANRTKRVAGKERVAALAEKSEKARRREFFAKLDAAYERNFPGMQSGDVRGRIAAGGRSGVIRETDNGVLVRRFIAPTSEQ